MPTGILFGQICVVLGVAFGGVWSATQWTAHALGYQPQLGAPWLDISGVPIYEPWKLFEWWYFYDAYAPDVFLRGHRHVSLALTFGQARHDLRVGPLGRCG
jgi:type IV secretion system protein VirD4